jgi:hypothetical protein
MLLQGSNSILIQNLSVRHSFTNHRNLTQTHIFLNKIPMLLSPGQCMKTTHTIMMVARNIIRSAMEKNVVCVIAL